MIKGNRNGPPSTNKYLLVFVKNLFVLVILLLLPKFVVAEQNQQQQQQKKQQGQRKEQRRRNLYGKGHNKPPKGKEEHIRRLQQECERMTCSGQIAEEAMNCIHQCVSSACFDVVYDAPSSSLHEPDSAAHGNNSAGRDQPQRTRVVPLEPGEIDTGRSEVFEQCVWEEYRAQRRINRQQRQNGAHS
uniref:Uncharacterized protein n=1 Tax=Craspedostauros australis TaxID=1486917 RepID=A0A7R9WT77_9STRA|mmetsp:Transcript_19593/g.54451  ORF Transcript_19593/g.54451 Transcript_19593/m.54451 type:complete len:187 (+) Transcript_19593:284-844(+)